MIPKKKNHKRIKPKYSPTPNAEEKKFREWVREHDCLICQRYAAVHHVRHNGRTGIPKDHWKIVPLCYDHHQGDQGWHKLGEKRFQERYKLDLYSISKDLLVQYKS